MQTRKKLVKGIQLYRIECKKKRELEIHNHRFVSVFLYRKKETEVREGSWEKLVISLFFILM